MKVKVMFQGISPILMNPMSGELLDELDSGAGSRKPKIKDEKPEEKAAKKVIKNADGQVGIPSEYLFSCLVEAGRLVKIDSKRSISTKESTLLPSFLSLEEFFFPFINQEEKFKIDRRRGVLSNAGKNVAVCITRPRFDNWAFGVTLEIQENEIAEEKVKHLIEKAGSSVGLGDFRPAKRGQFGRFKIASWDKV